MLTPMTERVAYALAGGLFLFALGLGAQAGTGDFAPGDDLIGSLPIMYPDDAASGLSSGPQTFGGELDQTMDVTLTLTGTMNEVEAAILDAYGEGWVEVEKTAEASIFTYVFHGDVVVDMKRGVLERGLLGAGLRPGQDFMGGQGKVDWNGNTANTFPIASPEIDLPFQSVLMNGAADAGPIDLDMLSRTHNYSHFGLQSFGDVIQLELVTY